VIKLESMQVSAKNIEAAVNEAIDKFNVDKSEVSYRIIQEPSKGFFGIGGKMAVLEVYLNENYLTNRVKEFMEDILKYFDENFTTSIKIHNRNIVIYLDGEGLGKLIGKHGRTLGALQHLIMIYVNRMTDTKVDIKLDIGEYRKKRRRKIEEIAEQASKKVIEENTSLELAPMFSFERKMVHEYISKNYPQLKTKSTGLEPYRKVYIYLGDN
jgi:spoIIIJ-associated protein